MNNRRTTIGQLINWLKRYPPQVEVELRLVLNGDTYITEPASCIPSKDGKGRLIVQVTNES